MQEENPFSPRVLGRTFDVTGPPPVPSERREGNNPGGRVTKPGDTSDAWKEQVLHRFSTDGDATKWNDMYGARTARFDDHFFRIRRDRTLAFVTERFTKDAELLDLGCGAGPVITPLRELGYSCVGLDYSAEMLGFARQRMERAGVASDRLLRGDSTRLPFPDAAFDGVICLGVISYIDDYTPVLEEIFRILRPGGTAIISFRNRLNLILWDPWRTLKLGVQAALGRPAKPETHVGRFLSYREVDERCREVGFDFHDFWGIGFGPLRLFGKRILPHRLAIPFSDAFTRVVASRSPSVERRYSDVSVWLYDKPIESKGAGSDALIAAASPSGRSAA
jgi:ubiquinone/menaquinone biosynthesis C-methylase UbiE